MSNPHSNNVMVAGAIVWLAAMFMLAVWLGQPVLAGAIVVGALAALMTVGK